MLLGFSGCNAVEFWLKGHGKYFRGEMNRLPGKPFLFDIRPYAQNENGEIVSGPNDPQEFIYLCNTIIHALLILLNLW